MNKKDYRTKLQHAQKQVIFTVKGETLTDSGK